MLELPGKHRNGTTFIFTASGPGTDVNQPRWTISQSYTILIKGLENISFTSIVFDRCNTIFVASMVMLRDVDLPYTQAVIVPEAGSGQKCWNNLMTMCRLQIEQ